MSRSLFARATRERCHVLVAGSASEAMAILRRHASAIAVVVTDFKMPGRNGDHLLREIATRYPHIVRILVTAYADKDMLLRMVNTGSVFRVLEKPLRTEAINDTVTLALAHFHEREVHGQRLSAMEETLAFLAHELNTPLATIGLRARGIVQDLANDPDPERRAKVEHAAASVLDNTQFCLAIIESFWSAVNENGGHPPLSRENTREVRATRLVANLLDTYPFGPTRRQWVKVEVQGDFVVRSMSNCITLVLSSLLSNALRAVSDAAAPIIRIEVSTHRGPEIRVVDNGPGIGPDIRARLLRGVVTAYAESGGHGMGMIFCDRIMQSFGGGVQIDSTLGAGTTITMNFGRFGSRTGLIGDDSYDA